MKTQLASLFCALLLSVSSATFANDPTAPFQSTVLTRPANQQIDVVVANESARAVLVRITDAQGETVASYRLGKTDKQARVRFDLRALQDGLYRINVTNGQTQQTHTLRVETPPTVVSRTIALS